MLNLDYQLCVKIWRVGEAGRFRSWCGLCAIQNGLRLDPESDGQRLYRSFISTDTQSKIKNNSPSLILPKTIGNTCSDEGNLQKYSEKR